MRPLPLAPCALVLKQKRKKKSARARQKSAKRRSSLTQPSTKRVARKNAPVDASSKAQHQRYRSKSKAGAECDEFDGRLKANPAGSTAHLEGSTVDLGAGSMVDLGASGNTDNKRRGITKSVTRKVLKLTSRRVGGAASSSRGSRSDTEGSDGAEDQTGANVGKNTIEKDPSSSPGSRDIRRQSRMKGGGGGGGATTTTNNTTRGRQTRVHHRKVTPVSSLTAPLSRQAKELRRSGDVRVQKKVDRGARGDMDRVSARRAIINRSRHLFVGILLDKGCIVA